MKKKILLALCSTILLTGCSSQSTLSSGQPVASASPTASPIAMVAKNESGVMVGGAMMLSSKDISTNAMNSSDHTTLVTALKAAGLVTALQAKGPFTVFAPTNEAFAKIPSSTITMLLKPESKPALTKLLEYHVVPGHYTEKDFVDGMKLKTLEGSTITITHKKNMWLANNATITIPDIISSNGVTFVIDSLLMPTK